MSNIIRASVVQAATAAYSLPDTLDKLERLTRLAKERDGSQLAVFPEAYVGGYPKTSTFGQIIGDRRPEGRDEFVQYAKAAIEIPSPALTRLEQISKDTDVFLVVGVIERDNGTLYCTVVFVDPERGYIAKHRKLVPAAMERTIWGQGDGTTLPVISKTFEGSQGAVEAKVSATICWENYMPLLRTWYYSQGTQIYCAPTVFDSHTLWQSTMTHIALEGRCFVLSACQFAQEKDYPSDPTMPVGKARDPDHVIIDGGSIIISPLGEVLAGPLLGEEGVLTADLDLDDWYRGKFDLDTTGHYTRNDVFQLVRLIDPAAPSKAQ